VLSGERLAFVKGPAGGLDGDPVGEKRPIGHILPPLPIEHGPERAVGAELLAQDAAGLLRDQRGVAQPAHRVGKPDQERVALLALVQRRLGAGAFDRRPGAIGCFFYERLIQGAPRPRRAAHGRHDRHHDAVLEQRDRQGGGDRIG